MTTLPTEIVILLGLASPFVALVALVVGWLRERSRQGHERKLQKAELESRQQSQLRQERLEAYTAYMAVCDRLHGGDHSQEARAELRKTVALVELVSTSEEVKDSFQALTNHLIIRTEKGETEAVSTQDEAAYRARHGRFTKAIQQDLGITPAAMQDPA
jgi:hypothetical protein